MAITKKQNVRFDFYQAIVVNKKGEEKRCDISDLVKEISKLPVKDRSKKHFGEPARMDKIHSEPEDPTLLYFHMLRLRDEGLASANEKSEQLRDISLDNGDYIAEDINCIFDTGDCVLMIQRNFHSLSISGVRDYLISMYAELKNEDLNLSFRPIPDLNVLNNALKTDKYRNISFRFASNYRNNLPEGLTKLTGPFKQIFDSFGGDSLTLTLGTKRSRPNLNTDNSRELISLIAENRTMFSSALVKGKQGDTPVEIYDLLKGKLSVYYKFATTKKVNGLTKKIHLDPIAVEEQMMRLFTGEKNYRELVKQNI